MPLPDPVSFYPRICEFAQRKWPPCGEKTLRTVACTTRKRPKRRPGGGKAPAAPRQHAKSATQHAAQHFLSTRCTLSSHAPIIYAVPCAPSSLRPLSVQRCAYHLRSTCHLHRTRYRDDRVGSRAGLRCMCHPHGERYTVRNTITMMQAKPIRSVGANTVPSINALVTVAETGSTVPIRLARTLPISLTPCM